MIGPTPVCAVCGQPHVSCGPASAVTPVDLPEMEEHTMAELREYEVTRNGVTTTLNLSDADARREGLLAPKPEEKARVVTANKARGADDKS